MYKHTCSSYRYVQRHTAHAEADMHEMAELWTACGSAIEKIGKTNIPGKYCFIHIARTPQTITCMY